MFVLVFLLLIMCWISDKYKQWLYYVPY